jgi:hypothetical protein
MSGAAGIPGLQAGEDAKQRNLHSAAAMLVRNEDSVLTGRVLTWKVRAGRTIR